MIPIWYHADKRETEKEYNKFHVVGAHVYSYL